MHVATLTSIHVMTPRVKQFQFTLEEEWEYRPGQHTVVFFQGSDGTVQRPYTMTNLPGTKKFCLAVKRYEDGTASTWLHQRSVGDEVKFRQPKGNLYIRDYESDVVLVSTGTGAAPMYAMLRDYLENGHGDVWYYHGERAQADVFFRESLDTLEAEHESLHVLYSLSDEDWHGPTGHVQEHIPERLESLDGKDFYACGVPEMVVDTEELLRNHGVGDDAIVIEGWEENAV